MPSASEFMLVARVLSGEILKGNLDEDELGDIGSEDQGIDAIPDNLFSLDPGIDAQTWEWLLGQAEGPFTELVRSKPIFTNFEFDRKVPLMFTLNIMCTYMTGYYQRNDRVRQYLDERATEFPERDEVISAINETAAYVSHMKLPEGSMWWNKANFFTLVSELSRHPDLRRQLPEAAAQRLTEFSQAIPGDYSLAAREAVSRKAQRELRGKQVRTALGAAE